MFGRRFVGALVGVCVLAASAWAQDYTTSRPTGKYEAPPGNAVQFGYAAGTGGSVTLPFAFPYYGVLYTTVWVDTHGFVQFNRVTNGSSSANEAFPTTSQLFDGVCAPLWDALQTGGTGYGVTPNQVLTWTTGTAPNRHVVFSWENVVAGSDTSGRLTFQVQLFETTGVVIFAYKPDSNPSTWTSLTYSTGMDSPGDTRSVSLITGNANVGHPGNDQQFIPRADVVSGSLLFDKIVPDAAGTGSSVASNQPLHGARIELRRSTGSPMAVGAVAADGTFSVTALAANTTWTGTLNVLTQSAACVVTTTTSTTPREWQAQTGIGFGSNVNIGTFTLGAAADSNGTLRSAFNVNAVLSTVRDWCASRTTDTIASLPVTFDDSATLITEYGKQQGNIAAYMTVAGASSGNHDAWDDGIVAGAYARHVLASVAASPSTPADYRLDVVTDAENAFADGFGCWLYAAVFGASQVVDGKFTSPATSFDLETPQLTSPRGPDVAGWVAASLFDLLDAANEDHDRTDGTAATDAVFRAVDAIAQPVTAPMLLQPWVNNGHDGISLARNFIHYRFLADDTVEPNDDRDEAPSLGTVGLRRNGLILNRFNEDWYSVTLADAATALVADATYDRISLNSVVGVEIRDVAGTLLATGSGVGPTGPIRAKTGAVPGGTYRIGVRHLSGVAVPSYTLQSYVPLVIDAAPLTDWTVGRDYDHAMGVGGGITPYTLTAGSAGLPPGVAFSPLDQHAVGTPTTPGSYSVSIELRDNGNPANVVTRLQSVTIHDALKIPVARYVGFQQGRALDLDLPTTGGTPPFTLSMPTGALPTGLAFAPDSFHVTGTAAAQASVALELDAVDVAGSADHIATRAVVAAATDVPNAPADLAAGDDACGWWFDAAQGSAVTFKAKTAKGRVKRLLAGAVLAPDRSEVLTARVKGKLGGLSVTKLVCPLSGRYYVIAASTDGEATQLLGSVAVKPPKAGKGKLLVFAPTDTTEIEVGAVPGATLTLKFNGDKRQQLTAKVVSVFDPDGTPIVFAPNVVAKGFGGALTIPLAKGGTWTVVLGATSSTGTPGRLTYSYKLAQPKGVAYSAD